MRLGLLIFMFGSTTLYVAWNIYMLVSWLLAGRPQRFHVEDLE